MELLKEELNMGLQIFELLLDTCYYKKKPQQVQVYHYMSQNQKKEKSLFSVTVPK